MDTIDSTKSYAMYLRKSRKDDYNEDISEVLSRHKTTLTALAKNMQLHVTKIYQEVVSGENISNRPEVQNLLRDVEKGLYAGVLVMEVERLARGDAIDQGIIQRTFFVTGTKIVTPMKTYDPLNEFDEEYFEYGLYRSRSEYKTIRRRINAGRMHSVREGKWIASTAPYGYERKKLEKERGYTLKKIPEEAEIVELIFDLYINGMNGEIFGAGKISNYLDSMGIKPRISKHWSSATIRDMIKNPAYIGKVAWGREKDVKFVENGKIITKRIKQDDYMLYDAVWDAIISCENFEKAQQIMKSHVKPAVKKTDTLANPLSGIVYCEKCGRLMTRLGPNKHCKFDTLRCMTKDCDNISAPIYAIEDEIVSFLKSWLTEQSITFHEDEIISDQKNTALLTKQLTLANEELSQLNKQLEKTYDLLEREIYTEELFIQRNRTIAENIKTKQDQLHRYENELKQISVTEKKRTLWLPKSIKLINAYDVTDSAELRNNLLKQLIHRVTYLKTERNHRGTVDNRNFKLSITPKIPQV